MPGSVIATAVITSPEAFAEVRQAMEAEDIDQEKIVRKKQG